MLFPKKLIDKDSFHCTVILYFHYLMQLNNLKLFGKKVEDLQCIVQTFIYLREQGFTVLCLLWANRC